MRRSRPSLAFPVARVDGRHIPCGELGQRCGDDAVSVLGRVLVAQCRTGRGVAESGHQLGQRPPVDAASTAPVWRRSDGLVLGSTEPIVFPNPACWENFGRRSWRLSPTVSRPARQQRIKGGDGGNARSAGAAGGVRPPTSPKDPRPDAVAGVVLNDAGHVLLIQRRDNGRWEAPGGVLELGETFEAGVRREIAEETGVHVGVEQLTGVYKNKPRPAAGGGSHTDRPRAWLGRCIGPFPWFPS